jgi:glycosyltransferase involved in cell wall biosynthesis
VTVGVPVYHGEQFVEQALLCLQRQTHRDLEVIISIDGPDPVCEALCRKFLDDPRFRLVVQPERLGWNGNLSWLMSEAKGAYWYFQQQDDLVDETYVEVLLDHLVANPEAVLAYCDIINFGAFEGTISRVPSTLGPPVVRELSLLLSPYLAVGFRGLTRIDVVRSIGGIPANRYDSFGCDMSWLAAVARAGELHRVPVSLYSKLYHEGGMTLSWHRYGKDQAIQAWGTHCFGMLEQALLIYGLTPQEERLLWLAAIERLTSANSAGRYLHFDEFTNGDAEALLSSFLEAAHASWLPHLQGLSEPGWRELEAWAGDFFRLTLVLARI